MNDDSVKIPINVDHEAAPEAGEDMAAPFAPEAALTPEVTLTEDELRVMCKERVCAECPEKASADDLRLRTLADMENLRKRLARDKEEHTKYAAESVLADLLPVLDNLDLALDHAPSDQCCQGFVTGVDMTRKVFTDTLARHGMEAVGEVGQEFSPDLHEAVGQEPRPDMAPGLVSRLMQRGWKLRGRTLRPARVMVSAES